MKRFALPAAIVAAVALTAGAAFAYFTSPGSGTGAGAVGSLQPVSISANTVTPSTALLPGSSGDTTFELDNPNTIPLNIVSVVSTGPLVVVGGVGCTAGNSGVTFSNPTGLSITVPANATGFVVDLPSSVSMSSASASGCQGARFDIPVLVTVHQA